MLILLVRLKIIQQKYIFESARTGNVMFYLKYIEFRKNIKKPIFLLSLKLKFIKNTKLYSLL